MILALITWVAIVEPLTRDSRAGSLGIADPKRAVEYLRMAGDRGDGAALLRLAYFACRGIGMAKDEAEGERLLNRAGETGNIEAQMTLGQFYFLQYMSGWVNDGAPVVRWLGAAGDAGENEAQGNCGVVGPALHEAERTGLIARPLKQESADDRQQADDEDEHQACALGDHCLGQQAASAPPPRYLAAK